MIGLALGSSALILKARGMQLSFDKQGWSVAIGAWLYLVLFCLAALAIAHIIKHSAGAIVTLLVWTLIVENILIVMSMSWFKWMTRYFPFSAGQRLVTYQDDTQLFGRWTGGLYFAGVIGLLFLLGAFLIQRRDA